MLRLRGNTNVRVSLWRSSRLPSTRHASAAALASDDPRPAVSLPQSQANPERLRTQTHRIYSIAPLPSILPTQSSIGQRGDYGSDKQDLLFSDPFTQQLAVLNACIASGNVDRAEDVARRLISDWKDSTSGNRMKYRNPEPLASSLPAKMSAELVRALLANSLDPYQGLLGVTASGITHRKRMAKRALKFVELLFEEAKTSMDKGEGALPTALLSPNVLAILMKGLTAPSRDKAEGEPSPAYLAAEVVNKVLPWAQSLGIDPMDLLQDPVFDVSTSRHLGLVTREEVLSTVEAAASELCQPQQWSEWNGVIQQMKESWAQEQARRLDQSPEEPAELFAEGHNRVLSSPKSEEVIRGIETLRSSLSMLSSKMKPTALTPTARQEHLEDASYDAARQLYVHEREDLPKKIGNSLPTSGWLQSTMLNWQKLLKEQIEEEISDIKNSLDLGASSPAKASSTDGARKRGPSPQSRQSMGNKVLPFLEALNPDKMALVTIAEMFRLCAGGDISEGIRAARAIIAIGKAIELEHHTQLVKDSLPNKEFKREYDRNLKIRTLGMGGGASDNRSSQVINFMWRRALSKQEKEGMSASNTAWNQDTRARVGSLLLSALIKVAKVERTTVPGRENRTETQIAFQHAYTYLQGKKLGIIRINPAVADRLSRDPMRATLHPRYLPMVVKPKAWLSWDSGGYLKSSPNLVRVKDCVEAEQYLMRASDQGHLDDVFMCLDILGEVPWQINRKVFDVISEVWNSGVAFADIPGKELVSAPYKTVKPVVGSGDLREQSTYRLKLAQELNDRRSAHSTRCDVNYKLEIARAFLSETFYYPHNLDFRGRAYPIPPNLSHIGDDLSRGLLKFAEAKPLGSRGLLWLKVHLANVIGKNKSSLKEREAYTMEHLDDIYDSADKPLEGRQWWKKADDPWQCLAACFELTAAIRSPDPTEFLSSLPIHQDGTCNGLQHYAALGGDLAGALQVNLESADRPSDVYSGVAAMVNEIVDKDAANGRKEALLLQGKVDRKVCKQTVMTTVYGVTYIGAKKQIGKQLKDQGEIPVEDLHSCAKYLSSRILSSIGNLFRGATAIQHWLTITARLISKSIPEHRLVEHAAERKGRGGIKGKKTASVEAKHQEASDGKIRRTKSIKEPAFDLMQSVIWTSPLGLPIVQPYRKQKKKQVATALQTVYLSDPNVVCEVDPRAQATAFPPNFIHSLDATHMMMTALLSADKFAFASVHDSYWTHACTVDDMSVALRESFIELHSQDILGKLRQEFTNRFKDHVIPVQKLASHWRPRNKSRSQPDKAENDLAASQDDVQEGDISLDENNQIEGSQVSDITDMRFFRLDKASLEEKAHTIGTVKVVNFVDVIPSIPTRGEYDISRVRRSLYFFS